MVPSQTSSWVSLGGLQLLEGVAGTEQAELVFLAPRAPPSCRQSHTKGSHIFRWSHFTFFPHLAGFQQKLLKEPGLEPYQNNP